MKNTIKIVFLGIVAFALIVFVTAPEQRTIDRNIKEFSLNSLPTHFEAVGNSFYVKKEELFKDKKYFIVLNHDSLILSNKLNDIKDIFLVANVSKTPWFMKKLAVDGKLEELVKDSKNILINDSDGSFVNAINLDDIKQNSYFIYKVNPNTVSLFKKGDVPLDAMQKGIREEDLQTITSNIKKALNL